MASALAYSGVLCILLCGLHAGLVTAQQGPTLAPTESPGPLHLTYYVLEIRGGPNSTLLAAAGTGQGNLSAIGWGSFLTLDNYLKEGPDTDSKLLGMITGTTVVTSKGGVATGGAQLNTQHIFSGDFYNASSLTVTGTILTPSTPWECIVPGGTGAFRGYSGYGLLAPVEATTAPPVYVYQWDIYISPK